MTARKTPAKKTKKQPTKKTSKGSAAASLEVPLGSLNKHSIDTLRESSLFHPFFPKRTFSQGTVESRDECIGSLMHSLNKPDRRVIARANEVTNPYMLRRPTNIMELDIDLGGGFPAGGCSMVSGPDNCIAEGTFVQYETRRGDGRRVNHKGGPVEKLYRRFHRIPEERKGKGNYPREQPKDLLFFAPSVDDDRSIFQNRIRDVVCSGPKECFELTTDAGLKIIATADHKFMTPTGYVRLGSLSRGCKVLVHNRTTRKSQGKVHKRRAEVYVKNHPFIQPSKRKIKDRKGRTVTYHYCRTTKARLVVEAWMNALPYEDYVEQLNAGVNLEQMVCLTSDQIVHHIDEDTTNDALENLAIVTRAIHMGEHWRERKKDFSFTAVTDRVRTITPVGQRMTYDLKMYSPFHNYVANNFVVHNSGKTWLLFKVMAEQQRIYGDSCRLGYAMSEGAFPFDQAINAGVKVAVPDDIIEQWNDWRDSRGMPAFTEEEVAFFKNEVGQFHIFRGATGEELLEVILKAVKINAYSVIGCDSLNGLLPAADASKELDKANKKAAHAYMIDNFFRHYIPMTTGLNGVNPTTVIFTQQVRANQERAFAPSHMQAYIKPWAVSGAYAAKHYKLIDLVISDRPLKKGDRENRHVVGKIVSWYLDKGKAGTHDNKSGDFPYYYALPGTDDIGELMASALKRSVLQQHGKRWVVVRPDTRELREEFSAPSQTAMRKMLEADPAFEHALRLEVLTSAGIRCLYA